MTYQDVKRLVEGFGAPCAYYQFEGNTALAPPFNCWYFTGSDDFFAENQNYQAVRTLVIEHYSDQKDFDGEDLIEARLQALELPYYKECAYIKDQRLYMAAYETDIYLTKEG